MKRLTQLTKNILNIFYPSMFQATKGPIMESAPYKTNVDRVKSLLNEADELRIAIIETFMIDDDTTYGPSTMSLFVEKTQKFVCGSLQVIC